MPAKSEKQRRLMCAAAHNPKVAKRMGISQSVAKEFCEASPSSVVGKKRKKKGK